MREKRLEFPCDFGWQGGQSSLPVDRGMGGETFSQQAYFGSLFFPQDFITEGAGDLIQFSEAGLDGEQVVIAGRGLEANMAFGYRQDEAHLLNITIGTDPGPHELGPAELKVAQVVGVIDDGRSVSVTIKDAVPAAVDQFFYGRHPCFFRSSSFSMSSSPLTNPL